jgi:phosphopantetheinyl transferase (holo-ACP synthase)
MIGNDIVDLQLAKNQSNWQRKGFLEKQFTEQEQKTILNSKNPFLQVWLFWSMKEAAYKCYVQEHQKRFFAPKKFKCKILSNTEGIVQINSFNYSIKIILSDFYIHSLAVKNKNKKIVSELFFINKKSPQTKRTNQCLLSYFPEEVKLHKNDLGVPFLYHGQKRLPVSISTSHHGDYGGFAFTLENES